jgi:hypothetical protein
MKLFSPEKTPGIVALCCMLLVFWIGFGTIIWMSKIVPHHPDTVSEIACFVSALAICVTLLIAYRATMRDEKISLPTALLLTSIIIASVLVTFQFFQVLIGQNFSFGLKWDVHQEIRLFFCLFIYIFVAEYAVAIIDDISQWTKLYSQNKGGLHVQKKIS